MTVEYVGAGAAANGAEGIGIGEFKVSEVRGFEESDSSDSCGESVSPIRRSRECGFWVGRGAFERHQP